VQAVRWGGNAGRSSRQAARSQLLSPAAAVFLRALIAALPLGGLPSEGVRAQGEASAVNVRSIGVPPVAASLLVAEMGVEHEVRMRAPATVVATLKEYCGHASPPLLEKVKELNKSLIELLGGTAAPSKQDERLVLPACIRTLPLWRAMIREGDGLGRIVKREFNFTYDERHPSWIAFARKVCELNGLVAGFSCGKSLTDPVLPKAGILTLPGAVARSQVEVDLKKISVNDFLERLSRELKGTSEEFFVFDAPGRAPVVAFPLVFNCSTSTPAEQPYNLDKLFRLVQAYTREGQRVRDGFGDKPSVITVLDTGIDLQNVVLKELLFKRVLFGETVGMYDSSNADVAPEDGVTGFGFPVGQFGVVSAEDIFDPSKVLYFHGTHVAGLALGRSLAADVLASDDTMRLRESIWPRLRVFRSLRRSIVSGKYELGWPGIGNGLDFALDRTGGLTENNVLNISVGSTGSRDMRSRLESLGNYAVVVAAAGNDGLNLADVKEKYPAAFGGSDADNGSLGAFVISVGASSRKGEPMALSNYSRSYVDLFAVGECQYSFRDGETDKTALTGTSQAAPWVSLTAALVQQMPLPTKHPSSIKNRILSSVRSDPRFDDKAESGGTLDPLRAIDVLVDHIRLTSADGRGRFVRALVDYGQSDKPCDGVAALGNIARYERAPDGSGRYRDRQRVPNTPPPGRVVTSTPLKSCGKINQNGKIRYYLDEDFEKLADGKRVELREDRIIDVEEFVSRAYETPGSVATIPARPQFKAVLLETTRIMAEP
jgi:subtilisin family serine protease